MDNLNNIFDGSLELDRDRIFAAVKTELDQRAITALSTYGQEVVEDAEEVVESTDEVLEEQEQLDELSKDTLKSYVKKGAMSVASQAYKNSEDKTMSVAPIFKRIKGLGKAADKLAK